MNLNKLETDKLNEAAPVVAREAIKDKLNSSEFEAAFQLGDARDWPVAVVPNDVAQALRKHGVEPPGQIVVDGIKPGKLQRKHSKVTEEQYQILQPALDRGGVYLQPPTLLVEYQDNKGQWWLYAIDLKNLRTRTIFDSSPQYRTIKFKQEDIKIIREWDQARWGK